MPVLQEDTFSPNHISSKNKDELSLNSQLFRKIQSYITAVKIFKTINKLMETSSLNGLLDEGKKSEPTIL